MRSNAERHNLTDPLWPAKAEGGQVFGWRWRWSTHVILLAEVAGAGIGGIL
jgi:hypothetical protein